MNNKKGISPIISTVLLIAIVVVLASIIFIWARSFLSESAVKNDRAVEITCSDVRFEAAIVENDENCNSAALDVNNIGNIPIHGIVLKESDESIGSLDIIADQNFDQGTLVPGQSGTICLLSSIRNSNSLILIPKVLAENRNQKIEYTCPEETGIFLN